MQITPISCLSDNYAYVLNDKNSKVVGVVDPSEAEPIISFLTKNLPNEWYNTPNLHMCTIQDFVNFCNKKNIKIDKSICLTNEKISEITKGNMKYKNIFSQLGIFLIE